MQYDMIVYLLLFCNEKEKWDLRFNEKFNEKERYKKIERKMNWYDLFEGIAASMSVLEMHDHKRD